MADEKKPLVGFSSSFSSLLNKNNQNIVQKPNFNQSRTTLESSPIKKMGQSSLSSLISKHKENSSVPKFETKNLEKLSGKYLKTNFTPKFSSNQQVDDTLVTDVDMKSSVICPTFHKDCQSSGDDCSEIKSLNVLSSKEEPIPFSKRKDSIQNSSVLSSSSNSEVGSPLSINRPASSPTTRTFTTPSNKLSSLSKLKSRYQNQNSTPIGTNTGGSPRSFSELSKIQSPVLNEMKTPKSVSSTKTQFGSPTSASSNESGKRFVFDLSSALITSKTKNSPGTPNSRSSRKSHQRTIVVDQLDCILDARHLLDVKPNVGKSNTRKRLSSMGHVICKKWKDVVFKDVIDLQAEAQEIKSTYKSSLITAFKFDCLSPDDFIQAKFKRR